jgi:hypothetical protein
VPFSAPLHPVFVTGLTHSLLTEPFALRVIVSSSPSVTFAVTENSPLLPRAALTSGRALQDVSNAPSGGLVRR